MKAFVVCALLATFAAVSFAHHLELCKKQDDQLRTELQCIGLHISAEANQTAMANHFTKSQISQIHSASTVCDPEAGHHHHHH
ncbi:hypothetical protein MRX96_009084 [Rhipicephalus microplus]